MLGIFDDLLKRLYNRPAMSTKDLGKLNKDIISVVSDATDVPEDVLSKDIYYDDLPNTVAGAYDPSTGKSFIERSLRDNIQYGRNHLLRYIDTFAHELTHKVQNYQNKLIKYDSWLDYLRNYNRDPNEREARTIGSITAQILGPKYSHMYGGGNGSGLSYTL